MSNTWVEYVARVSNDEPQAVIAERVGVSQGTISRWLSGKKVPTEAGSIAAFAVAYQRNPIEAFVAAGALTLADAAGAITKESRALLVELGVQDDGPDQTSSRSIPKTG